MKQPIRYDRKQESGIRHILKKIFAIREIVILLLVLVLGVFMALNSRQFLTTANFKTIGNYMANDMIIGAFLTISLIAGNTDFSVGSNMGCSAFVCGLLLKEGHFGLANVAPTVATLLGLKAPACWEESML